MAGSAAIIYLHVLCLPNALEKWALKQVAILIINGMHVTVTTTPQTMSLCGFDGCRRPSLLSVFDMASD